MRRKSTIEICSLIGINKITDFITKETSNIDEVSFFMLS